MFGAVVTWKVRTDGACAKATDAPRRARVERNAAICEPRKVRRVDVAKRGAYTTGILLEMRLLVSMLLLAASYADGRSDEVFSHPTHDAADFPCTRCHQTALTGARAGFPTGKSCQPCHRGVPLNKLILPPPPAVYRLLAYVLFRHSQHAGKGIKCDACHGDVWSQDPIEPVLAMTMKACVDCHRTNHASSDVHDLPQTQPLAQLLRDGFRLNSLCRWMINVEEQAPR